MILPKLKIIAGCFALAVTCLSAVEAAHAQRADDRIVIPVQAGIPGVDTVGLTQLNMRVLSRACRKLYPRSEIPRMRLGFHALLTF